MNVKQRISLWTLFAGLTLLSAPALAEVTLKAISALPAQTDYTKSFRRFIELVNGEGKGGVKINFIGGPEVTPPAQQADAVRQGIVDVLYGPATYWLGIVPEGDALLGSNVTAVEARANGGLALLDGIYQKKLNSRMLGWFDTGISFHIYTAKRPRVVQGQTIEWGGTKIRSSPAYIEFFNKLGITNIAMGAPDVYTALERGIVDGIGWPLVGISDFGWERFLKYRVDPGFFQIDLVLLINLAKWNSLSPQARKIIERAVLKHEKESFEFFQTEQKRTRDLLQKKGLETITLTGAGRDKYLKTAFDSVWERLRQRDSSNAAALRARFYRE